MYSTHVYTVKLVYKILIKPIASIFNMNKMYTTYLYITINVQGKFTKFSVTHNKDMNIMRTVHMIQIH